MERRRSSFGCAQSPKIAGVVIICCEEEFGFPVVAVDFMSIELLLNFSDANQLTVSLNGQTTQSLDFAVPIAVEQLQELKWYLEFYASQYMADIDDDRANRQAVQLKQLGKALYEAAFDDRAASRYFDRFLENKQSGRMLTINASQPEILALPWELLCVPGREAYVFR
jgi:hypothetical protein